MLRAARRGPVPAHPEIRQAATRLAEWQLAQSVRQRTALLILSVFFVALSSYNAIVNSPVHLLTAALWVALPAVALWGQKRLRQRIALLEGQEVGA